MQTAAVIAEYNPFHNGHAYHIEETRKKGFSHIVAIMSGNFVQRGSMVIADKFERAKYAVLGGVDLVIELPLPWCMSAAHDFAVAGVEIAQATGVVNTLSFGCETGDVRAFLNANAVVDKVDVQQRVKKNVKAGFSYPQAVTKALRDTDNDNVAQLLLSPNNMLAFEYCNALKTTKITPCAICRMGTDHDSIETNAQFASASYIRNAVYGAYNANEELYLLYNFMPNRIYSAFASAIKNGVAPLDLNKADIALMSRLRLLNRSDFQQLPLAANGIENRLYNAVQDCVTFDQVCDLAKNKQITHARIRRALMFAALRLPQLKMEHVPYLRILGMNARGAELLKLMKETSSLPIIQKHSDVKKLDDYAKKVYDFNMKASDLYYLCLPCAVSCGQDALHTPFIYNDIKTEE